MEKRYEMRFTGSGGQGVILASVILAEAAIISDVNAIQSQAYGPEARGGMCKAETILSKEQIFFSKVVCPNFLLALTQKSLDQYLGSIAPGAVVIADASLCVPEEVPGATVISMPILETARVKVGKEFTANIVAVGAINRLLGLFSDEVLMEAVMRHVPAGTEALNEKALAAGRALVSDDDAAKCRADIN